MGECMTYVKCYKYGTYPAAATNPCVVETNGSTPASCNDISPAWFSDDFEDGVIDTCKWTRRPGPSYLSESGGKINIDIPYVGQVESGIGIDWLITTDIDFTMSVDFSDLILTHNYYEAARFAIYISYQDGTAISFGRFWIGRYEEPPSGRNILVVVHHSDGTNPYEESNSSTSGILSLVRSSGTDYYKWNGVTKYTESSNTIKDITLACYTSASSERSSVKIASFTVTSP